MATYAVGDVQGCYSDLRRLLDMVGFEPSADFVWFTGDLVNRGPENLATVRFVKSLGESAVVVLGNHDLYAIALFYGCCSPHETDTLDDLLASTDSEELFDWMRKLPLIHRAQGHILVHAGIPHFWDYKIAQARAAEVEEAIRGENHISFFSQMLGNHPSRWIDELTGMDRLRCITNYLTRMRFIEPDGTLDFDVSAGLEHAPNGHRAWFQYPTKIEEPIIFGHWASLNGCTGHPQFHAVDTGCVWGRSLTALRLEDHQVFRVHAISN